MRSGGGHADDDASLHPRSYPLVDPLELRRRTVGGHHHLLPAVEKLVQHVAELLLHRLAGQELHVVDQQDVYRTQLFLEVERGAIAQRADELDRETLHGQVAGPLARVECSGLMRDRLQEVRLAEPYASMDVERIVGRRASFRGAGHRPRGAASDIIGAALAEGREGEPRVERRPGRAVAVAAKLAGRRRQRLAWRSDRIRRLLIYDPQCRPPQNVDAADGIVLLSPQRKQLVAVMRFDPALQKDRRN